MLEELVPGIWTVDAPLKLAGVDFGMRMTVVQIGSDGLVLISPCPIDDALAGEIESLGTVRAVIAPNAFHHFHLIDASERYSDATCFMAQGVARGWQGIAEERYLRYRKK